MTNLSLSTRCLNGETLSQDDCFSILSNDTIPLLTLLQEAYTIRQHYFDNKVHIHILNNAQNGSCPEDCGYCAQASNSSAPIDNYKLKSDKEILAEAKRAYENGAFRYCMVSSGRGPKAKRIERLSQTIRTIKETYPLEVCLSTGFIDDAMAKTLKEAGLDRLNHNLNTSEAFYPKICTTHTYQDRLNTLKAAKGAELNICSGIIVGMGETQEDIYRVACELRDLEAPSIPVNFFMPIEGAKLTTPPDLSPEYCLRVLCLFRFLNPSAEIRVAAGREIHFRSMEIMSLYPANSLFLEGYLNTKGAEASRVFRMIQDAGFSVASDFSLDDLLKKANEDTPAAPSQTLDPSSGDIILKTEKELRPTFSS